MEVLFKLVWIIAIKAHIQDDCPNETLNFNRKLSLLLIDDLDV
jgi:hypothetical protein